MISVGDGIVGSPDKQKVRSQHYVQVIPCWPLSQLLSDQNAQIHALYLKLTVH